MHMLTVRRTGYDCPVFFVIVVIVIEVGVDGSRLPDNLAIIVVFFQKITVLNITHEC